MYQQKFFFISLHLLRQMGLDDFSLSYETCDPFQHRVCCSALQKASASAGVNVKWKQWRASCQDRFCVSVIFCKRPCAHAKRSPRTSSCIVFIEEEWGPPHFVSQTNVINTFIVLLMDYCYLCNRGTSWIFKQLIKQLWQTTSMPLILTLTFDGVVIFPSLFGICVCVCVCNWTELNIQSTFCLIQ